LYSKWELLQFLLWAPPPQNWNDISTKKDMIKSSDNDNDSHNNEDEPTVRSMDDNDDDDDDDDYHDKTMMHSSTSTTTTTTTTTTTRPSLRVQCFGNVFILAIIVLSFGRVIVESLIFLYFEELGSSFFMMGCTVVLTVVFEIPVFAISARLLEYFGTSHLLRIAMICYIVRVIGYSFIPHGHVQYAFLLEPLHGVTYACSQTAVVDFVHQRTPRGYEATGQSFVYIFRGLGSVLGLIIGGYMTDVIGARMVYRIAALIVSVGCLSLSAVSSHDPQQGADGRSQQEPAVSLRRKRRRTNTTYLGQRNVRPVCATKEESIEMIRSAV
jgi:hypothetical protein